jgi:coenzyme F420-reducing hydrogenase delta subunit
MFRYKELIKRLDKIEEFLHIFTNTIDTNQIKIEKSFKEECHNVKENVEKIVNVKIENISQKLDSLYFDNEKIKHQLFLENELKKTIQDIDNLSITIHNTIELINYTIYKIDRNDD